MNKSTVTAAFVLFLTLCVHGCGDASNHTTVNTDSSAGLAANGVDNSNGPKVGWKPSTQSQGEVARHSMGDFNAGRTVGVGGHPATINDSSGLPTNNRRTNAVTGNQQDAAVVNRVGFDNAHRTVVVQLVDHHSLSPNVKGDETSASHGRVRGSDKYVGDWHIPDGARTSQAKTPLRVTVPVGWTVTVGSANVTQPVSIVDSSSGKVVTGTSLTNRGPTVNRYGAPRGGTEAYISSPNTPGKIIATYHTVTPGSFSVTVGQKVLAVIHVTGTSKAPSVSTQ